MGLNPQGQPTRQTSEESVPDTEIRGVSWTEGAQCGTGFEAEKSLVWLEGKEWEGSGGGQVRESGRRQLKPPWATCGVGGFIKRREAFGEVELGTGF